MDRMTAAEWRTQATDAIEVSTVRVRYGLAVRFETALIGCGKVSDPRLSGDRATAGLEHDRVVEFVRQFLSNGARDKFSARHTFLVEALRDLGVVA